MNSRTVSADERLFKALIPEIVKINIRFVPDDESQRTEFIINFIKTAVQEKIEQLSQQPPGCPECGTPHFNGDICEWCFYKEQTND